MAETTGEAVATLTVCLDGRGGLPADENFRDRLDRLREGGSRLWEPCRVAVASRTPKRVFAGLMHIGFMYAGTVHSCTHAVIEVNPRHERFYVDMMGFERLGTPRQCSRVDAPAVLLCLDMEIVKEKLLQQRQPMAGMVKDKTFYSYFFKHQDALSILGRLGEYDFKGWHD